MDVIIGIAPHKSSHTAVVIDHSEQVLDQLRLVAGQRQIDQLPAFAEPWPDRRWAVEGAAGLGRLVAQQFVRADEQVIDVPATLSARVRLLSGGSVRKTDSHDARSTAIAALHGRHLRQVTVEDTTVILRMLADRRDQLSRERNRILCRIHNQVPPPWQTCAGSIGSATTTAGSSRRRRLGNIADRHRRHRPVHRRDDHRPGR